LKITVMGPVKNEAQFIGYSVMSVFDYVHEFVYAVAPSSNDGTLEILQHIAKKYGKVRILLDPKYDFDPLDMRAYNESYNDCIRESTGDAVWFLHPDMIVTNPEAIQEIKEGPLAWTVNMTSFAKDLTTVITKGRSDKWKNIHAKKFGLHYYGGYGSTNEDFYFSAITANSHKHHGTEFQNYPFEVFQTGINVNHYCELKPYKRRLEKMKLCLRTQAPDASAGWIEEKASQHPRVTLEPSSERFGTFEFKEGAGEIPSVFEKYADEFEPLQKRKGAVHV